MAQGFGFACTSYRLNGLAILEGAEDVRDLADIVRAAAATAFPSVGFVPVLVTGGSEGGAVATHVAERFGGVFQGALSTASSPQQLASAMPTETARRTFLELATR
jgi:hypothetical protein